ncbi:uncharacterized protein HMPREF1120_07535 [Exophiala dermatitidis NIH/UT8656]|uniref:Uncharacterized protein n=1 Tax=Exophiala dermatitidis (strain ATCC 34100 / CBS 525.76 / NIH/UT8656) TaxID=858893 RepID=H6C751_EXODN|nr:uncharacterized protein HMPREF1120_07535 [Exophiala dermatitidis NIH/UT8656]EHY59547.1 hypothetical protein HMPREF1120_07535 [Exophiala dermatitidis NIH/UT8656]
MHCQSGRTSTSTVLLQWNTTGRSPSPEPMRPATSSDNRTLSRRHVSITSLELPCKRLTAACVATSHKLHRHPNSDFQQCMRRPVVCYRRVLPLANRHARTDDRQPMINGPITIYY